MAINVKRCYFHSIQPLISYESNKTYLEEIIDRLNLMLEIGYLVPKKELYDILPQKYRGPAILYQGDSVFLAQHILTELNPIGGSYQNGEFSAYLEHISGSPALVFGEDVTKNKKIENRNHPLSEEVCIQDRISLKELIAISLPYETPLNEIKEIFSWFEEEKEKEKYYPTDFLVTIRDEYQKKLEKILKEANQMIEEKYEIVKMFQDCLEKHKMEIPCIRDDGTIFNKEEEYQFMKENKEKILKLSKKENL